jgi:hypothetical protein
MQRYIEQLIEDIQKATWKIKPPHDLWDHADLDSELELEDMSYVEKYIYGDSEPISDITGIDVSQLPPPEKLTVEQQALLAGKLEDLLKYFNFCLEFPQGLPDHLKYTFIKKFWAEEQVAVSCGTSHIEFCDYNEGNCPFRGYCNTCKEVIEQFKHDEEIEKKYRESGIGMGDDIELPF